MARQLQSNYGEETKMQAILTIRSIAAVTPIKSTTKPTTLPNGSLPVHVLQTAMGYEIRLGSRLVALAATQDGVYELLSLAR